MERTYSHRSKTDLTDLAKSLDGLLPLQKSAAIVYAAYANIIVLPFMHRTAVKSLKITYGLKAAPPEIPLFSDE